MTNISDSVKKAVAVSAAVLLSISIVSLAPTDAETCPLTVVQDYDLVYTVYVDQDLVGPGVLRLVGTYYGQTTVVNVSAAAPYAFSCDTVVSVEYISESGTVYTWNGEVVRLGDC